MIEVTTVAIAVAATSGCGLLGLLATLIFLWRVYKRGGRQAVCVASVLDRMRIVNRRHLEQVLAKYVDHVNQHRLHRSSDHHPPERGRFPTG